MKLEKNEKRMIEDLALLITAIVVNTYLGFLVPLPIWALTIVLVCFALQGVTIIDVCLAAENKPFPAFKRMKPNQGVIYHLAVGGITIIFVAFIWMLISYPMDLIYEFDLVYYPFPLQAQNNVTLIHTLTTWFPFFVLVGVGIYVFVNAFRQPGEQYGA